MHINKTMAEIVLKLYNIDISVFYIFLIFSELLYRRCPQHFYCLKIADICYLSWHKILKISDSGKVVNFILKNSKFVILKTRTMYRIVGFPYGLVRAHFIFPPIGKQDGRLAAILNLTIEYCYDYSSKSTKGIFFEFDM